MVYKKILIMNKRLILILIKKEIFWKINKNNFNYKEKVIKINKRKIYNKKI